MNERGRGDSFPLIGGSSLLVIFSVLCLTVFALLCLSTVQADGRLTDASQNAIVSYYTADAQAEAIFAELRSGTLPEGVREDGMEYSYECTVNAAQSLFVTVEKTGDGWEVRRWQTAKTNEWAPDNSLNVWTGTVQIFD